MILGERVPGRITTLIGSMTFDAVKGKGKGKEMGGSPGKGGIGTQFLQFCVVMGKIMPSR